MKLRDLNGAIRKSGDKITIGLKAPDGREILIRVPRSGVLDGLKEAWPDGGETDIYLDDSGRLRYEANGSDDAINDLGNNAVMQADMDAIAEQHDEVLTDDDLDIDADVPAILVKGENAMPADDLDDLDDLLG